MEPRCRPKSQALPPCPTCGGAVHIQSDQYGRRIVCWLCGREPNQKLLYGAPLIVDPVVKGYPAQN